MGFFRRGFRDFFYKNFGQGFFYSWISRCGNNIFLILAIALLLISILFSPALLVILALFVLFIWALQ